MSHEKLMTLNVEWCRSAVSEGVPFTASTADRQAGNQSGSHSTNRLINHDRVATIIPPNLLYSSYRVAAAALGQLPTSPFASRWSPFWWWRDDHGEGDSLAAIHKYLYLTTGGMENLRLWNVFRPPTKLETNGSFNQSTSRFVCFCRGSLVCRHILFRVSPGQQQ